MQDVKIPGEPGPPTSPLLRRITLVASALTTASITVNLILQVATFANKRPVQPDQRDRVQGAKLALTVMRQLPGLITQFRLLLAQVRAS